ncbi:MAG TPA: hypothetical protein VJ811_19330 [Sphingopyxis sp.]|nr:hypothetical protein [Sphingopyxis sp.]
MSTQTTALPAYGGIRLPLAIGAVVEGVPSTFQTPLSGQVSPVLARVPIGRFAKEAIGINFQQRVESAKVRF